MGAKELRTTRKQLHSELIEKASEGIELSSHYMPRFLMQRPRTPAEAYLQAAGLPLAGLRDRAPWYTRLDPLDVLFFGASGRYFDYPGEFGAARTRWIHRIRHSTLWPTIEALARLAADTAMHHCVSLDDPALAPALCRTIEKADWAKVSITPDLLPDSADEANHFAELPEPAEGADDQVRAFWQHLEHELPGDGSIVDTLRTGLHKMGLRGTLPSSGPHLLATGLATALDCPVRSESWTRLSAYWWYHSLPTDSPLFSILGIIWEAEIRNLDAGQTLARLFGCPDFRKTIEKADVRWRADTGRDLPGIVLDCGYPIAISHGMVHFPFGSYPNLDDRARDELADLFDDGSGG